MKTIAENRKIYHNFEVIKKYIAGISLLGYEVRSIKSGRVGIRDGFVRIIDDEAYIVHLSISILNDVKDKERFNPQRRRKLLLNKNEIMEMSKFLHQRGYTAVPLEIGTIGGKVKLEIAIVKGLKKYDKREKEKLKSAKREMERAVSQKYR